MCGCRVAGVFVISAGVCVPRPHVGLVCVHHSSATLAGRGATGAQRLGAHMRGWKASHFVPVVTGVGGEALPRHVAAGGKIYRQIQIEPQIQ